MSAFGWICAILLTICNPTETGEWVGKFYVGYNSIMNTK